MYMSREEFYLFGAVIAVLSAFLSWLLSNITESRRRRHEEKLAIQEALRKHDIEKLEELEELLADLRRSLENNMNRARLDEFILEVELRVIMVSPNLAVSRDLEQAIAQLHLAVRDTINAKNKISEGERVDKFWVESDLRRAKKDVNRETIYLLGTYRAQILGEARKQRKIRRSKSTSWFQQTLKQMYRFERLFNYLEDWYTFVRKRVKKKESI